MNRNSNQLKSPRHAGVGMIIGTIAFAMLAFSGLQARTWTSAEGGKTFEGELQSYDPESGKVTVTLSNRKRMTFEQDKLSADDIAWLKKNGGRSAAGSGGGGNKIPEVLPTHDDKEPDTTKPVKVYFLSGQSNMCGEGRPATLKPLATEDEKFAYLLDDEGNWTVRKDVHHIYYVMDKLTYNGPLNVGARFGPELGVGHIMGHYHDEQVLLIKGACGNRSLGFDFLPPSSRERLGLPMSSDEGWYGGISYDRYVKSAKAVLANLEDHLPGYKGQGYEMAGFFWWQGHKDRGMAKKDYQKLLGELIKDFRKDFEAADDTPFVTATVAFNGKDLGPWEGVFDAQMGISKSSEFKGNVASVDIRDIGGGGAHYGNNGATYAKVGDRMGRAMAKLKEGE
jgi:alpha-galactosidase